MPPSPDRIASLNEERQKFRKSTRHSAVTVRGYGYDIAMFQKWCAEENLESLPATDDTVALFVVDQLVSGKKIATVRRRWSAIIEAHRAAGLVMPSKVEIREILNGAQRIRLETPRQMTPLNVLQLGQIVGSLGTEPLGCRNRAIVLFGFASALRVSTLSALLLRDLEFTPQGLVINVRVEKQDQKGEGRTIGMPYGQNSATCPVVAMRAWLLHRGTVPGPLFVQLRRGSEKLSPSRIGRIVKACAVGIGLDPRKYCGHSLRSGFITAAGENNVGELLIAAISGHKSMAILRRYFRKTDAFKANAAGMIGL